MHIFAQASQGLNLSPAQRAFLKLLKGWFYTALSTGIMAGAQYLLNNQQVNWVALIYIAGGAFLLSILSALDKYWTAQGDAPLALLTEAGMQRVQAVQQQQPVQPVSRISQAVQPPARPQPLPQPIVLPPAKAQPVQPSAASAPTQVPQVAFPVLNTTASYAPLVQPQSQTIDFGTTGVQPIVPGK